MPTIDLQGTKFTFSVLPLGLLSKGFWAKTTVAIENEYVSYAHTYEKDITREDLEEWIFSMFRLLAGAYGRERNVSFRKMGLAVDLYPHTINGEETSREERRRNDCTMTVSLLMRNNTQSLGGVYSLLLHREEIQWFASKLRAEFDEAFARFEKKHGKYLFVGVSPKGYTGCNYWYLDPTKKTNAGDRVWVRMGRHNTEQIVHVDSVRYFSDDTAPYDPETVKRVLRKATETEIEAW